MDQAPPAIPESFWKTLAAAPQRVLLLDYDGTLAPFRMERDQAFPYPGIVEILERIQASGHSRLIIVSGRSVADILPLLRMKNLPEIWGSHGFERRLPDGFLETGEIDPVSRQLLTDAYDRLLEGGYADDCEKKPSSIAFHWRRAATDQQQQLEETVRDFWTPLTANGNLQIHRFDGGLELRYAGFHKGRAVEQVLAECGSETVMAYLGDDLTDEDAFEAIGAIKGRGLSILVRQAFRETMADAWLRPPDGLTNFLWEWHRISLKK